MRPALCIVVLVGALVLAASAAADQARLETVTEGTVAGARVVYIGDGGSNDVTIDLARSGDFDAEAPDPRRVIGFRVDGPRSVGAGCEPTDYDEEWLCRVPGGTRLLAPRAYGRGASDWIEVSVPRRGAIVWGGAGSDNLSGPEGLPMEAHGGPGNDGLVGAGLFYGGPGNDEVDELTGESRIIGGEGDDTVWGSERADVINAGPGRDWVSALGGNDVVRTTDGQPDTVFCDEGRRDTLIGDGRDLSDSGFTTGPFSDCERLRRSGEPLVILEGFYVWEGGSYVELSWGCPPDGPVVCVGDLELRRSARVIARRAIRAQAGEWGYAAFPLGVRRIQNLLGKPIRITIRWRDRAQHTRSISLLDSITEPEHDSP